MKIIGICITLLLVVFSLPFGYAETSENYTYEILDDGTVSIVAYKQTPKTSFSISVPSQIDGHNVTKIGQKAFAGCRTKEICLPDTVVEIGDMAFEDCSMSKFEFPSGLVRIGDRAFCHCYNIEAIKVSDSVKQIGDGAFEDCWGMKNLQLPGGLSAISNQMCYGCSSLCDVTIPNSVISIGDYAFAGTPLIEVFIPSNVTSIGRNPFSSCGGLTNFVVDGQNTIFESVNAGLVRKADRYLVSAVVANLNKRQWEEANISTIGNSAYRGAYWLGGIDIPASVKYIDDYAFFGSALRRFDLPQSIETIGSYAFSNCDGLNIFKCYSDEQYSLTSIGDYAFSSCLNLLSVRIPKSVIQVGSYAFYHCTRLEIIQIYEGVSFFGNNVFQTCMSLKTIALPDSLTSIGECPFIGCKKLQQVIVHSSHPRFALIDGVLFDKSEKKLIWYSPTQKNRSYSIPNGIKVVGKSAFSKCSSLKSITLPDSVCVIQEKAFDDCTSLKQWHVQSNSYAEQYCIDNDISYTIDQ